MAKNLSVESLTKKLKNVANTQDSIPMFSLWIIHHKAHHELIVNTWLEILKSSKTKHRLTLWYLANDVIQSCHRKKADIFKDSFANILPEAIAFLRDKSILPGVERVLKVWSCRNVYDTEIIDQLHAALLTNRPPDKLRQKLLVEYKPALLVHSITSFKKREDVVHFEEKQLTHFRADASSSDDIHKLKDKVGGEKFSKNFEESALHMERFICEYENYIEERKNLVETLSKGAVFYRAQYHEAKIVVNAYQSFDSRVTKMKRLVDKLKLKMSQPLSVIDMKQTGERDEADMDMSESDEELGSKPSQIISVDTNILRPIPPNEADGVTTFTMSKTPSMIPAHSTPNQHNKGVVKRPGMRGASSVAILSSMQDGISGKETTDVNIPVIFDGIVTPDYHTKHSPPSASPPSPTDSPELNISSPPRHQSLESRLADIFSGAMKEELNVGSESDAESLPPATEPKSPLPFVATKESCPQQDSPVTAESTASYDSPNAEERCSFGITQSYGTASMETSWQNTIPVIGGNRTMSLSQAGSVMHNLHLVVDGSSTPLQDEPFSEAESYMTRIEEGVMPGDIAASNVAPSVISSSLPPPSFSGDALNFLTKFMGQKTNTVLVQPEVINKPLPGVWDTSTDPGSSMTGSRTTFSNGTNINWNSVEKHVGKEEISWLRECVSSAIGAAPSNKIRNEKDGAQNVNDLADTDYRVGKSGDQPRSINKRIPLVDDTSPRDLSVSDQGEVRFFAKSLMKEDNERANGDVEPKRKMEGKDTAQSTNQFMNILRRRSAEKTPSFAPMSDSDGDLNLGTSSVLSTMDYIVEEEEIELDEDTAGDVKKSKAPSQEPKLPTVDSNDTDMFRDFPVALPQSHNRERLKENYSGILARQRNFAVPEFPVPFPPRPSAPNFRMPVGHRTATKRPFRAPIHDGGESICLRGPMRRPPRPWNDERHIGGVREAHHSNYLEEEEYYDMLYKELQPEFHRGPSPEMYRQMPY